MITSYGFQKDQIAIRTCWGEAGGFLDTGWRSRWRSRWIREILNEFLSTSDSGEVARCIRELDVPHYHHEIGKYHKKSWIPGFYYKCIDRQMYFQFTKEY